MSANGDGTRGRETTPGDGTSLARRLLAPSVRFLRIAGAVAIAIPVIVVTTAAIVGGGFGAKAPVALDALYSDAPVVMAHRGLAREHPENSRAAFEAARRAGFTAVEVDVKRSVDGHFYLFHDRRSSRLLGVDVDLNRLPLDELQRHPLLWNGRETDQRILTLAAFADEFADDFVVYLDIKRHGNDDYRRLTDEIAAFVDERGLGERVLVGGDFLFITCLEFRYPALHTSLGSPGDIRARTYRWIPKRFRPDFMISRLDEVTPGHLRWLRETGLIDRWILHDVHASDLARVREWGISKILLD